MCKVGASLLNHVEMNQKKPRCHNCIFSGSAFKVDKLTHHHCESPQTDERFFTEEYTSPWDTLRVFNDTCEDHEFKTLVIGDWIKADIIGLGFYEVVSVDKYHLIVKCLKIFGGINPEYRGHETTCHKGTDKETGKRIPIDQKSWVSCRVKRNYQKNQPNGRR